ncbi:DUF5070 domain-containing protein [Chlamydiifrater volucris]|uniref:DUF5070 domain-containing protein n=1 Tax=Chlamydiifrater volucris TaxID=2681470 RepID=UPI001BCB5CF4|nr:DUF5070 domain-containing protein [Chlamydiifrater volucris]
MRITIHLEQKRFFRRSGYILFEDLISEEEGLVLLKGIRKHLKDKNNDPRFSQDIYRLLPEIVALLRKRKLGQIAVELSGRSSLALVGDLFVENAQQGSFYSISSDEGSSNDVLSLSGKLQRTLKSDSADCYLVLYLNSLEHKCCGIYFSDSLPENMSFLLPGEAALCLAFSDRGSNAASPLFK